jgi:tRNA(Ile)-lysidine synthase
MATRRAVTEVLADLEPDAPVLVACSGGGDSLALAAATSWVATRSHRPASAVVVDHGLQPTSAEVARDAADICEAIGLDTRVVRVEVVGSGGPEAAARAVRYAALETAAGEVGAGAVLLGHTREDQAETVLLRLARGSGARSLAAMAPVNGLWRRPFLDLPRAVVRSACVETLAPLDRQPWEDPHNEDPDFARVRVRRLLADLVDDLGPGVVSGLARSADLLRADADALDAFASAVLDQVGPSQEGVDCALLADLQPAVRTRVLRALALRAGCPGEDLGVEQVRRIEALVIAWTGQGEIHLPGGVTAERTCGRLCLRPTTPETGAPRGA